jgi:integrase/recombinase XerD
MAQGKQAKTLNTAQTRAILNHLDGTRWAERNRAMFLLSVKAGLRAKEIASLTWSMVTDPEGNVADTIQLEDKAAKGDSGRTIPMNKELQAALKVYQAAPYRKSGDYVLTSERANRMAPTSVATWFYDLYKKLGYEGCSSHSGRRTFVTNGAKKIVEAGGSLRDIQQLVGHKSLQTTQRYIEGDSEAKRKLVDMI